ncbi:MAG: serine hydrolase [Chitinophagales bacterium]|nr:serine hydrolase [Chitinophagales bacterium]
MKNYLLLLFLLIALPSLDSEAGKYTNESAEEIKKQQWIEARFAEMSESERLGQFFMVAVYSNKSDEHKKEILKLIEEENLGGLIFFKGTPAKQLKWTNEFQERSGIPLMISIDGEWGLSMRLDSTLKYPKQITLGAIENNDLIYKMGYEIGLQCKRMGIHVNLAPVVDVNTNPKNPVINYRSFGENKFNVAMKGLAYMNGMQNSGIMACAKHFPGHGDTDHDSHHTLPVINHDLERLNSTELFPFKILFNNGLKSAMVAHINVPALDKSKDLAVSLSRKVTTDLLKVNMGFAGLVFSDALNMKGVSDYYKPGVVDAEAFIAGNDILLFSEDVAKGKQRILEAVKKGKISQQEVDSRVKKILAAKYDLGLTVTPKQDVKDLYSDLNQPLSENLIRKLYESALTIAADNEGVIPFRNLENSNFASLVIGQENQTEFQDYLSLYAPFDHFNVKSTSFDGVSLMKELKPYDRIVIGVQNMSYSGSKNYGISTHTLNLISSISKEKEVTVVVFGSPYSLANFENVDAVLCAYEENSYTEQLSAQLLFGGIASRGKLPVTAGSKFIYGSGVLTEAPIRLKYTIPEEVNINRADLLKIDSIAYEAINTMATPGCQVLVAKEGKVFYHKSFGNHTYSKEIAVQNDHLYDIASITKIAASTISLMYYFDEGSLDIYRPISHYLKETKGSSIGSLMVRDILLHEAGLQSWIPFYKKTVADDKYESYYCTTDKDGYEICVSDRLFIRNDYPDSIWNTIQNSFINPKPKYVYSDLGFYMFERLIKRMSGQRLDTFTANIFYKPLGMSTIGYLPLSRFDNKKIVPTEVDIDFRKQLVDGHVHDPGAAMMGGIGGHAGLFSNANDLAVLMQMLLNGGSYGGQQYLQPNTVNLFTSRQSSKSRRGLGFDKPETDPNKSGPTSSEASPYTFGHSGFTGTGAWADPYNDVIFIFLSNRVYPDANNWKLVRNDIRTRMQSAVYQAIEKSKLNKFVAGEE